MWKNSKFKISKFLLIFTVIITCAKHDYNPKLVEYLKAEKDLRSRVNQEQGLSDSIKILQKEYNIDLEKELSKFKDNPEAWVKLLKELRIEK